MRQDPRFPSTHTASWIGTVLLAATGLGGPAFAQSITEFPVPTAASTPFGITAGPDGALWFTEGQGNKIGRIETDGDITEFPIPTAGSVPGAITLGPDGNLWFVEFTGNQVGRLTPAGVFTEFPIPTAGSQPSGITAGPDGNLWFTERTGNKIGRITTAGTITEFPIDTADSRPADITAGPDGNLWFAARNSNKIGRITTAGVITEFPVLTAASGPRGIAAGPDGNLWFTEQDGNKIGRITTSGTVTEYPVPTVPGAPAGIAAGSDGDLWFVEVNGNKIGRISTAGEITEFTIPSSATIPVGIAAGPALTGMWFTEQVGNRIGRITAGPASARLVRVDAALAAGTSSNVNGVLESGETVQVAPSWRNNLANQVNPNGLASNLEGPAGPVYTIDDGGALYGAIDPTETSNCADATGDCYLMTVTGARPVAHWDATFHESLAINASNDWTLHVGGSFADVPTGNIFYAFIENLFHNGVTGGCAAGYCPSNPVTRAQMAVFLLKSKLGADHVPPEATGGVFDDVPITNPFAAWIEELAELGVTGGCGGPNYCPNSPVTRKQMAVFLLKTREGSAYDPPDCSSIFADVACTPGAGFSDWIEELYERAITGGCSVSPLNYCPENQNNRGQMAVFLVKTFGLSLYGP